jgi:hypothetical protein
MTNNQYFSQETFFNEKVYTFKGIEGNLIGNVTGDITGDITGDVIGNLIGDVTGNVSGNVIGNLTGDLYSSGISTFANIRITSELYDGNNIFGSSGQILSSDGTKTSWINASAANVGSATSVGINTDSANTDRYLTFVENTFGNNTLRVNTNLTYNPNTNTLSSGLVKSNTTFRVGNANLSSGGDYAHLATYEYYNGSSWVYQSATAGGLYQITGQSHNWYKHNGSGTHTTLLTLDSSGNLVATANVTAQSDIKLKKDIQPIQNALDKVLKLRGVTFIRKDIPNDGVQIGVIAQEVEKVIPEVVKLSQTETPEGNTYEVKTVAYANLVGLLIEAIKDQHQIIDDLKKRVGDLENKQ